MVIKSAFTPKIFAALLCAFVALCSAQRGDPIEPVPGESECISLRGGRGFVLTPTSISSDGLSAVYVSNSVPKISPDRKTISSYSLSATCSLNGPPSTNAPSCNWAVTLGFCNLGGTCTPSDPSYRSGTFFAYGTGPRAYKIEGGTQSFRFANGSINSLFIPSTFELRKTYIRMCYLAPL